MWLKQNKSIFGILFFLLFTGMFSVQLLSEAAFLKESYHAVSIRLSKGEVTSQQIENALKMEKDRDSSNIPEIAVWKQLDKAEIKNLDLGRIARVMPVLVVGNMGLVVPYQLVSGNLTYEDDSKGCVIDENTAYQLFGTKNATGNTVTYQKKTYYIRGVIKAVDALFLIQERGNNLKYSNIELSFTDQERGEEFAQSFMVQNGLGSDFLIIDGHFYSQMIGAILGLPLWFLFLAVVFWFVNRFLNCKNSLGLSRFILYGGLCLFAVIGLAQLLYHFTGAPIYFPEKLIPTKWSDFDHWVKEYQLIVNQIRQVRYLPPNFKDVILENALIKFPYQFFLEVTLYYIMYVQGIHLLQSLQGIKLDELSRKKEQKINLID